MRCRYAANPPELDFTVGYSYAIATTSSTVMTYLKTECIAANGTASPLCTFAVDYPGSIPNARRF